MGFAGEVGRKVPVGAQYIYNVNYFSGLIVSAAMYFLLTRIFPIAATSGTWNEVDIDLDELMVADGQEVDADHLGADRMSLESGLSSKTQKGTRVRSKLVQ